MSDQAVDPTEFAAVKHKVEDHDRVLDDLETHLSEVSKSVTALAGDVNKLVGWFGDKRTKYLALLVVGLFLGPDGVAQVKDIFGL